MTNASFKITVAAIAICIVVVASPQLLYPLWFDQGAFAACANVIRSGGAFLRDCWEVRGVLTPLLYVLPLSLAPDGTTVHIAVHAFDLMWQIATAVLIGIYARRKFGAMTGVAAGALYGLMYASLNYWATAQAEGFANLFFVGAMLLADLGHEGSPSRSRTYALLAGVCSGVLFWAKYPFVVFVLFVLWLTPPRLRWQVVTGCVIALLIGALYFVLNGAVADLRAQLQYDLATFNATSLQERWHWFTTVFWVEVKAFVAMGNTPTADWKNTVQQLDVLGRGYPFIFSAAILSAFVNLATRAFRRAQIVTLLYFVFAVALNVWQGHSYRYHFVIILPPLALLTAALLSARARDERRATFSRQSLFGAVMVLLACIGMIAAMLPWLRDAFTNVIIERKSPRAMLMESRLADYLTLAEWLQQHSAPTETISVFSDVPSIYTLAQRANATRFPYMRWADEAGDAHIKALYAQQLLDDLSRNRPRYFILSKDNFPWQEARFINTWKSLAEVNQYVEQNHHYISDIGAFVVFERN